VARQLRGGFVVSRLRDRKKSRRRGTGILTWICMIAIVSLLPFVLATHFQRIKHRTSVTILVSRSRAIMDGALAAATQPGFQFPDRNRS